MSEILHVTFGILCNFNFALNHVHHIMHIYSTLIINQSKISLIISF